MSGIFTYDIESNSEENLYKINNGFVKFLKHIKDGVALVEEHYYEHMDTNNQPTSDNAFLYGNEYHEPDYSEKSGLDVIDFSDALEL